jgi:hypothetical protein
MDLRKFIVELKTRLDQESLGQQDGDTKPLLEMLFNVYSELSGFDNDVIRQDFDILYESMNGKTLREMDQIIYPVCTLCRDHEKAGFIAGIKTCIRLAQEISI